MENILKGCPNGAKSHIVRILKGISPLSYRKVIDIRLREIEGKKGFKKGYIEALQFLKSKI
jgi:hypothetical protein